MELNFYYAAYSYFNEYWRADKPCIEALEDGADSKATCVALSEIAKIYNINRNMATNKEEECRLEVARSLLMDLPKPVTDKDVSKVVGEFAEALGKAYPRIEKKTGKLVKPILLSSASKFLWMRFQNPIVMYDRYAFAWVKRNSLPTNAMSYSQYLDAWRKEFFKHQTKVKEATRDFTIIKPFTLAFKEDGDKIQKLVDKLWFQERVFDHAIIDDQQQYEKMENSTKS